jgi:hypothetical protein
MKRATAAVCMAVLVVLGTGLVFAHPHINKTVTAALPGNVTATVTYNTTPANENLAKTAAVGEFTTPRGPRLKLSADLTVAGATIPAGEYVIGVIKNSDTDWTMALYAGQLRRGEKADPTKVTKLESLFTTSAGTAAHMLVDISPGSGKFEGRITLTLHFGTLFLSGALS